LQEQYTIIEMTGEDRPS